MKFNLFRLHQEARTRLSDQNPQAKQLVRVYALVWALVIIAVSLLSYYLTELATSMTGLTRVTARSRVQTIALVVPLVASLALIVWDAGYSGAALDLARGNAPEWKRMTWGFGQLHRLLVCGLLFMAVFFAMSYVVTFTVVLLFPSLLMPTDESSNMIFLAVGSSVLMLVMYWLIYNRRLLFFFAAEHDKVPSSLLPRLSINLLRGYRWQFFRIDLSFWWYYVLKVLIAMLPYVSLFLPETYVQYLAAIDLGLMGIYVAATAALEMGCRNRIWVTYALAYDEIQRDKRNRQEAQEAANQENTLPEGRTEQ